MALPASDLPQLAQSLGSALAVGLLVGLERGWRNREVAEGGRVAGLRTFALIGLLGGALGLLPAPQWPLAAGLGSIALLFAVSYRRASDASGKLSITSAVAALATFALGAIAAQGQPMLAVGAAVVVALLLDLKPELHGALRRIDAAELDAVLQLGVLSAVILPLLPDTGLGPFGALNPFRLWLAVVLIAALSLLGHFAVRLRGEHQGLLWVGMLGGLTSSTAATLALSRSARAQPALARAASAAILASWGVMFARVAVVMLVLRPGQTLGLVALVMLLALATFAAAAWHWRGARHGTPAGTAAPGPLFDLPMAIGFGAVLGLVAIVARVATDAFGSAGLYGVAFVSGLADVDAIVISTVQMLGQERVGAEAAAIAILLALLANMLVKAGMARVIGGREVGAAIITSSLGLMALGAVAIALAHAA